MNWTPADVSAVPVGLPYIALGVRGDYIFLLDAARQFRAIRIADLSKLSMVLSVFAGEPGAIFRLYPRMVPTKSGQWVAKPGAFLLTEAIDHMLRLCSMAGPFNPEEQVRGRGAWLDEDAKHGQRLVLSRGDALLVGTRQEKLCMLNGFAYPAGTPVLTGHAIPGRPPADGAAKLAASLGQWQWQYPKLGPMLLTGWLALAPLSGAVPVKPMLGLSGGERAGRGALLQFCRRLLGPWAVAVHEPSEAAIADAAGWDPLAAIIDAHPAAAVQGRVIPRRKPWWSSDAAPPPRQRMLLGRAETFTAMGLDRRDAMLALALSHAGDQTELTEAEAATLRPWLIGSPAERWRALTAEHYPAWCELLAVQERPVPGLRAIAILLAAEGLARGSGVPTEADFNTIEPELNQVMLAARMEREPVWRIMLEHMLGLVLEKYGTTVLHEIAAAAGYGDGEEGNAIEGPSYYRTEREAAEYAKHDARADTAISRIGPLGLRVWTPEGAGPGYRRLAVAFTATARAQLMERVRGAELPVGATVLNTLVHAPGAERLPGPLWFRDRGTARAITLPLGLVLDRLVGPDPEGTSGAWDQLR